MNEKCKKYFRQTILKFLWHIVEMHFNEDYFTTAVCMKKREILSHWKNISWNQLFSNFYSMYVKPVAFTKFLLKKCEREFSHHTVEFAEIYSHTFLAKISWKQRFY